LARGIRFMALPLDDRIVFRQVDDVNADRPVLGPLLGRSKLLTDRRHGVTSRGPLK
jgi:hypothetical protein